MSDEQAIERVRAFLEPLSHVHGSSTIVPGLVLGDLRALATPPVTGEVGELRREIKALRKVVVEAADALDIADGIIELNLGTDTPKEWDAAMRRVARARAKV